MLPGALGNKDHCVCPFDDALFERRQKAVFAVKHEGGLRNQGEVDILAGDRGARGDKSRVAAHDFDYDNPVMHAVRLGVRAGNHLGGLFDSAQVAKGARNKGHVIVDGLRDADDGKCVPA